MSEAKAVGGRRDALLSLWSVVAAFGAYFCMYAFRKPFTAGSYSGIFFGGVAYKTVLVIAQVMGYTLSKFIGIKVVAEVQPQRRALWLLGLVACAEGALLLFAVTPAPYGFVWLCLNGLPLGMVFGMVLGVLEGRRHTEALTAGLCASFIVADGAVKSVGATVLSRGVSPFWMPFVVGLLFVPPLLLFAWMLSRVPMPSPQDVEARAERVPMNRDERRAFFLHYALGLTLLGGAYLLATVLRSVRADFAPEIWRGLGVTKIPSELFARSETTIGVLVPLIYGAVVFIKDNRIALGAAMFLAIFGGVLIGISLMGLSAGMLSPYSFMVLSGLGLYLPYIAVHATIFERLIAMTRDRGNIGYLMYLVDAFGYLGYVAVLLARNFWGVSQNFLVFYTGLCWSIAVGCVALLIPCWRYFAVHPFTRQRGEFRVSSEE